LKQKYYNIDKLLKVGADYNILLGERSNGKSYQVKTTVALTQSWNDQNKKFIYLRRWDVDCKTNLVEQYFLDAPVSAITDGECTGIICYQGKMFFAKQDEKEKWIKIRIAGYIRALSQAEHYKSGAYNDVENILFEEFITDNYYLPDEPTKLMQFVSTVARRRKIHVYMVGNSISRICPYFKEWQLTKTIKQEQGTIEVYYMETTEFDEDGKPIIVTIAVEFCANSGHNSKMFFGTSAGMITSGAWQTKEMPHLPGNRDRDYHLMHTIYLCVEEFKFQCEFLQQKETGIVCWYVKPKTTKLKQNDRIIVDRCRLYNQYTTIGFVPLAPTEQLAFSILKEGKIFYCDNLTGTDFEVCMRKMLTVNATNIY
jgi:hypothetical protein